MSVSVLAYSGHKRFRIGMSIPKPNSVAQKHLYKVCNFCSTLPFCCGVYTAVYSTLTLSPSRLHDSSNDVFYPALSHRIIFTTILNSSFNFLMNGINLNVSMSLCDTKKLNPQSDASSWQSNQCFCPPMPVVLGEKMSINILSSGTVALLTVALAHFSAVPSLLHNHCISQLYLSN